MQIAMNKCSAAISKKWEEVFATGVAYLLEEVSLPDTRQVSGAL
jgi:hypothetical protein